MELLTQAEFDALTPEQQTRYNAAYSRHIRWQNEHPEALPSEAMIRRCVHRVLERKFDGRWTCSKQSS